MTQPSSQGPASPALTGPRAADQRSSPRVVLVDDNDLFRASLRALLDAQGVAIVGEASSGGNALDELRSTAADVVVMDLNMPGIGGVEAIRRLALLAPRTRVLVLTSSHADADVTDAILAGASGYLLKQASIEDIVSGIRAAAAGESLISPPIASKLLRLLRDAAAERRPPEAATSLSQRELEVLKLLANGKDNAQIAADLCISPKTVKNHISNILTKLGIENRIQAAVFAVRSGIA